jgi:hypothetical protein
MTIRHSVVSLALRGTYPDPSRGDVHQECEPESFCMDLDCACADRMVEVGLGGEFSLFGRQRKIIHENESLVFTKFTFTCFNNILFFKSFRK